MIFNPVIVGGTKLPELENPGTAADLLAPKQLIDAEGNALTGTIATKAASDLTASGATVSVPAGYYATNASKSVATATQAAPSITVSSAGLITASATQTAGYVSAGTKSATRQLTTKAAATITPGTTNQTIASGTYLTGTQTIKGDANLLAANIKSGISIFGVAGTMSSANIIIEELTGGVLSISSATLTLQLSNNCKQLLGLNVYANDGNSMSTRVTSRFFYPHFKVLDSDLIMYTRSSTTATYGLSYSLSGNILIIDYSDTSNSVSATIQEIDASTIQFGVVYIPT